MVLATLGVLMTLEKLTKIMTWMVVAGFLALVLNPAVDLLNHRLNIRRTLATFIVFVLGMATIGAMLYAFIRPIVDQANGFSDKFPEYVQEARNGQGPVGGLVKRYKIDEYVDRNQQKFREGLQGAGKPAAKLASSIFSGLTALITILVLTFLFLLQGPRLVAGTLRLVPPKHRSRVSGVAKESTRAITGYMGGNIVISIIAGVLTYGFLQILGVPFAGVLALWVAFADLIPLIGATLGAAATVGVAFLSSPKAGIAAIVFYVVYQQFENHILQPSIMSRTVDLNPLAVIVSVLVGVELFGILGALLAIPAGGVIQVIARNIFQHELASLHDDEGMPAPHPMDYAQIRKRQLKLRRRQAAIAAAETPAEPEADT